MAKKQKKPLLVPVSRFDNGRVVYLDYCGYVPDSGMLQDYYWDEATKTRIPGICTMVEKTEPFQASLIICGRRRGRSAAQVIVQDDSDTEYTMFLKGFLEALQTTGAYPLVGTFIHVKKGSNYGIELHG